MYASVTFCRKDVKPDPKENFFISKWIVSNDNHFESLEFSSGNNYIIVKRDENTNKTVIFFDKYRLIKDKLLSLEGFGQVRISNLSDDENKATFEVNLDSNAKTFNFDVSRVENIDIVNSSRTNLISKTWELNTINGNGIEDKNKHIILFSKVGTYYKIDSTKNTESINIWKWKNDDENIICFSPTREPKCDGSDNEIKIKKITDDTLTLMEENNLFSYKEL